ncbi:hypothetical protein BC828DRAFT_115156 [Blastocladiella britannica]|nr:hypothetical protein BC828DRAFT_115156 [Blastocladiella britannica]
MVSITKTRIEANKTNTERKESKKKRWHIPEQSLKDILSLGVGAKPRTGSLDKGENRVEVMEFQRSRNSLCIQQLFFCSRNATAIPTPFFDAFVVSSLFPLDFSLPLDFHTDDKSETTTRPPHTMTLHPYDLSDRGAQQEARPAKGATIKHVVALPAVYNHLSASQLASGPTPTLVTDFKDSPRAKKLNQQAQGNFGPAGWQSR